MITFNAIMGLFFSVYFAGLLWPHQNKDSSIAAAFSACFARSLLTTWLVVVMAYFFPVGHLLVYFMYAGYALILLRFYRRHDISKVHMLRGSRLGSVFSFAGFLVITGMVLVVVNVFSHYELIFRGWDAVVSWNRWAIELSKHSYSGSSAHYPIFIPGVWSFIYHLQGTSDIWVFAKLFIPLSVVIMCFYGVLLLYDGRAFLGLSVVASLALVTTTLRYDLTTGYMDAPLSVFILFGYLLIIHALRDQHTQGFFGKLVYGFLILGIAAAIKGPGLIALFPAVVLIIFLALYGLISLRQSIFSLLIMALPFTLFLIIFFSQAGHQSLVGNLGHLASLSSTTETTNQWINALKHFFGVGGFISILLLILASMLCLKIRHAVYRALAISSLITAIVGFIGYVYFASYSARNSYWLLSMIILPICSFAAYKYDYMAADTRTFGFQSSSRLKPLIKLYHAIVRSSRMSRAHFPCGNLRDMRLSRRALGAVVVLCILVAACVGCLVLPNDRIEAIQNREQATLGGAGQRDLVLQHIDKLGDDGLILSSLQPLAYNSLLPKKFALCRIYANRSDDCTYWLVPGDSSTYKEICRSDDCATDVASKHPNSLFLARKNNVGHVVESFASIETVSVETLGKSGAYTLLWIRQRE